MSHGYFPVMIKVSNQRVVIIGGGTIAATRKAQGLLDSGAGILIVVAPSICQELQQLVNERKIVWKQMNYQSDVLEHAALVFAATDDAKLNEQISNDASGCAILVCNVSDGEQGSFITPAVARSGGLTAMISSAGTSPGLVKHIKQQLKQDFLPPYEQVRQLMQRLRADILRSDLNIKQRQRMLSLALTEALAAVSNQNVQVETNDYKENNRIGSILSKEASYKEWFSHLYVRTIQDEGEDAENGEENN